MCYYAHKNSYSFSLRGVDKLFLAASDGNSILSFLLCDLYSTKSYNVPTLYIYNMLFSVVGQLIALITLNVCSGDIRRDTQQSTSFNGYTIKYSETLPSLLPIVCNVLPNVTCKLYKLKLLSALSLHVMMFIHADWCFPPRSSFQRQFILQLVVCPVSPATDYHYHGRTTGSQHQFTLSQRNCRHQFETSNSFDCIMLV
jgi:hypothetical protein